MIRTFIALPVAAEIQQKIGSWQDRLRRSVRGVSWVKPGNIHITLKFLGDIPEEQVDPVIAALDSVAESAGEIPVEVSGQGVFPNRRKPRVLWAGLQSGVEQMRALVQSIDAGLEPLGFFREQRPFKAHLTAGRIRRHGFTGLPDDFFQNDTDFGSYVINELIFMRSQLDPGGSIYTPLKTWPLKPAGADKP